MIFLMSYTKSVALCSLVLACMSLFILLPVQAFTADSLDITVQENGNALATFRFTLEGLIENAIPQSILEEELTKGLTTSSDPPELKSMDRSTAVLLMKKFADTSDVPTGTEYRTATMDFKKAEIALENSALSGAVSADFSPSTITLTFPDSFRKQFSNVDVLPAVFHTVEDPVKVAQVRAEAEARARAEAEAQLSPGATIAPAAAGEPGSTGSVNVSSSPSGASISIDSRYAGEAPGLFSGIAAGSHIMEFSKEGYATVSKSVLVNPGKTTNIMVVLTHVSSPAAAVPEDTSSPSWIPILVVITGIIILCAGGYYWWMENETKRKAALKAKKSGSPGPGTRAPVSITIPDDPARIPAPQKPDTLKIIGNTARDTGPVIRETVPVPPEDTPSAGSSVASGDSTAENTPGNAGGDSTNGNTAGTPDPVQPPHHSDDDTGDECR
jgi:hypothetical protein